MSCDACEPELHALRLRLEATEARAEAWRQASVRLAFELHAVERRLDSAREEITWLRQRTLVGVKQPSEG